MAAAAWQEEEWQEQHQQQEEHYRGAAAGSKKRRKASAVARATTSHVSMVQVLCSAADHVVLLCCWLSGDALPSAGKSMQQCKAHEVQ